MTRGSTDAGASLRAALAEMAGDAPDLVPVALGWATVDLDRTGLAFAEAFGEAPLGTEALPDDRLLGARCRGFVPGAPGVPVVILLEPSTEGRLAAALARHGEGPAAIWFRAAPVDLVGSGDRDPADPADPRDPQATAGRGPIVAAGPLGTELLLPGGPPAGPFRLLVLAAPGTITS